MSTETTAEYLDPAALAAFLGVSVGTVYTYKSKGVLPEPDGPTFGITPTWQRSTIEAWKASRAGQGKGGGRRPREVTS